MENQELSTLRQNLTVKTNEFRELAAKVPPLEHAYQEARAKKALELRADGHPAGLIDQILKGTKPVSDLRYDRDLAISVRDACRESIKSLNTAINSAQTEIRREMQEYEVAGKYQT